MGWSWDWIGSNGSSWGSAWTVHLGTGGIGDIQSNKGRLASGATAFTTSSDASSTGLPQIADVDFVVRVNFQNPKVTQYGVVGCRCNWGTISSFPATGYFIEMDISGNTYKLHKTVSSVDTVLGSTVAKTFTAGTDVYVRMRCVGNSQQVKVWNVGTAEPSSWDITQSDTAVPGAGTVGFSAQSGAAGNMAFIFSELVVSEAEFEGWGLAA